MTLAMKRLGRDNSRSPALPLSHVSTTMPVDRRWVTCPACGLAVAGPRRYSNYRVCDECSHHRQRGARETIEPLIARAGFRERDSTLVPRDPIVYCDPVSYRDRSRDQQHRTFECDAFVTRSASIHGSQIVIAAFQFTFFGGSLGMVGGKNWRGRGQQCRGGTRKTCHIERNRRSQHLDDQAAA